MFLEDYDMYIARLMIQGVDIWLNNPHEAAGGTSGTSGQKAAAKWALNLSILDGWWIEVTTRRSRLGYRVGRRLWVTRRCKTMKMRPRCTTFWNARWFLCSSTGMRRGSFGVGSPDAQ